jgi:hypothetical protein
MEEENNFGRYSTFNPFIGFRNGFKDLEVFSSNMEERFKSTEKKKDDISTVLFECDLYCFYCFLQRQGEA